MNLILRLLAPIGIAMAISIHPTSAQTTSALAAQEAIDHVKYKGCKINQKYLASFGLKANSTATSIRKAKMRLEDAYNPCETGLGKYRVNFAACVDYLSGR